jgi:hypothetical protein
MFDRRLSFWLFLTVNTLSAAAAWSSSMRGYYSTLRSPALCMSTKDEPIDTSQLRRQFLFGGLASAVTSLCMPTTASAAMVLSTQEGAAHPNEPARAARNLTYCDQYQR